ncbi:hypothetical protein DSLASN_46580 [Desulfoluna limicola]|uniref:RDD domain-containing protein n=1 Tax=Desulfoluna limicola TaxID=2810562 RepID=A0ABN6F9Y2_9BACT|nr:RDD family protein [Desulfoluna limicola]BCS99026.1 hypothetical protein DSLASN_46580 [Desulfoluna limicola]
MNSSYETPKYAGFWIRALAFQIDISIIALPICLIGTMSIVLLAFLNLPFHFPVKIFILMFLVILPVYFVSSTMSSGQATLGKRTCNIYVGNALDKSPISFIQTIGRLAFVSLLFVPKFLSKLNPSANTSQNLIFLIWALFILFSFLLFMSALTREKTAFHDLIFKTRVFRGVPEKNKSDFDANCHPQYILFPMLLAFYSIVLPIFTTTSKSLVLLILTLLYSILFFIFLFYYKRRNNRIYEKFSFFKTLPYIKQFLLYLSPAILLVMLNYGLIFYIKLQMS